MKNLALLGSGRTKIKCGDAKVEQINLHREYLMLLDLVELLERALTPPVFVHTPTEHLDTEHSPSFVYAGIVPASGGTMLERPTLTSWGIMRNVGEPPQPDDIIEGFAVTEEGNKIVIGSGKYRKNGEIKEFGGAVLEKEFPDAFVTFNLLTEQAELTMYLSPFHRVLR